ncbi:hypothetical protein AB6A40_001092 [Gnathostoma spinigerum]|uniref:Cytochrome b-c1 complex subunit Rieske, mitochondrial n=1 Tax=Gnathostoma spinigerum TaxID=75299 RepID=A0ABD6EC53_9BILA
MNSIYNKSRLFAVVNKMVTLRTVARAATLHAPFGRSIHTDQRFPRFENCLKKECADQKESLTEDANLRRSLPVACYFGVGGIISLIVAKESIQKSVLFKWMPADQQALLTVKVPMDDIPEGHTKTVEWRGKPVFVRHRTVEEIENEQSVDISKLRDPQHDSERVIRKEWLVVIGVCRHLGCIAIPHAGPHNGFFCPCHGTDFDVSGRIRRGPAPVNLEVPPYKIEGRTIVIG